MGSANGKHRRPRQAPAIVVAAGVTGSAIAIPLLGASGAHAADATTWDRVAECESGGTWSADFGNGSYGGLQLSPETWKAYGGESYAERADLASRAQQIAVAQKVLEDQGPQAWPSCAVISGLATDGTLPGVDPGTAPSVDPEQDGKSTGKPSGTPDDEADPSDGATGDTDGAGAVDGEDGSSGPGGTDEPSGTVTPSPDPSSTTPTTPPAEGSTEDPADTPGKSVPSGSPESSSGQGGKHRGAPAVENGRGAGADEGRESGRHASRGGDGARDTDAPVAADPYTVRPGDSLWVIAEEQKVPGGWGALYEANRVEVGSDPDLILPGQRLDLDVRAE
ncbi:transglycosylase family protein [Streptomyces sp. NPDC057496]|uniref:transglycosylase family protein n=1 Tax=Streptomyces sp. NPDC057496 TaxID=3346149 RepID=UPI0036A99C69